eukprot:6206341-Pleurochrysis_carterae.AAC.2
MSGGVKCSDSGATHTAASCDERVPVLAHPTARMALRATPSLCFQAWAVLSSNYWFLPCAAFSPLVSIRRVLSNLLEPTALVKMPFTIRLVVFGIGHGTSNSPSNGQGLLRGKSFVSFQITFLPLRRHGCFHFDQLAVDETQSGNVAQSRQQSMLLSSALLFELM